MASHIFLSYAKEDIVVAERLYRDLSSLGITVWFDKYCLKPGEKWKPAISLAIRTSTYFLALLSKTAIDKRGYVQREVREALEMLLEVPENEIFVIPIRLDDCIPSNSELCELQWIDLFPSYDDGFAKLRSFLIPSPLTAPPVAPAAAARLSRRFGDEARQLLHGLVIDRQDNILLVGDFWGNIDFGGMNLQSAGDRDIFVAKFDKAGNHIWSKRYGDNQEQVGVGLGTDDSGAVVIVSAFNGSLAFGGAPLVSRGRYNVGLAKLDPSGNHIWSRQFGDERYHVPECIAVSPSGTIVIAGRFQGSVDFGRGSIESRSEQTDVFLAAFGPNGECIWSKQIAGRFEQQSRSIAIDPAGRAVLAGVFKREITVDGETLAAPDMGQYCGFLALFDESGNATWCKTLGEPPAEQGSVVGFDPATGDIIAGGFVRNNLPRQSHTTSSSVCLLARYSQSGLLKWSKTFGNHAFLDSLAIAKTGRILLTGYFSGSIDFGNGPLFSAGGGLDVFAAIFNGEGNATGSRRFGDEWQQYMIYGAQRTDGAIVLAGSFHGSIDFGNGPLVATGNTKTQQGNEDVFLAILDNF